MSISRLSSIPSRPCVPSPSFDPSSRLVPPTLLLPRHALLSPPSAGVPSSPSCPSGRAKVRAGGGLGTSEREGNGAVMSLQYPTALLPPPPRMWMRTWRRDGEGARSWRGWRGWRGALEHGSPPPHPRGGVGEGDSNARGRTRRSNWRFSIAGRSGLRGGDGGPDRREVASSREV